MEIEFGENPISKRETINGMDIPAMISILEHNIHRRNKELESGEAGEWMGRTLTPNPENVAIMNREEQETIERLKNLLTLADEQRKK